MSSAAKSQVHTLWIDGDICDEAFGTTDDKNYCCIVHQ